MLYFYNLIHNFNKFDATFIPVYFPLTISDFKAEH